MSMASDFPQACFGLHPCGSCRGTHYAEYGTWCRAERQRLHPSNFERWSEAEHSAKSRSLTWDEQQTVWAHIDAWEWYFDGDRSLEQTRQHISYLEPLPQPQVRITRVTTVQPAPAITREQEAHLMATAAAGRERAREAEAEFNRQTGEQAA